MQTDLSPKEYNRFKQRAKELRMTEYKLAQEAILVYINEPEKSMDKTLKRKFLEFWESLP